MSDNINVPVSEITPLIEELISQGADVRLTVNGNSMFPMLHSKSDSVILTKPYSALKKYDIPLYKRENGQYVLHRIVKVKKGVFTINGDNQYFLESPVYPEQICAVVKSFYRKGKLIYCDNLLYRLYCVFWVTLRPFRGFISKCYIKTVGKLKRRRKK